MIIATLCLLIAATSQLRVCLAAEEKESHCIWYGQSHMVGVHWLNKAANIEPQPVNDESAEAVFKQRCSLWYAEYKAADPEGKPQFTHNGRNSLVNEFPYV